MSDALDLHDVAVLAVDDIEDNLDLIEEFLEDEVWSVLRALSGEDAIRMAREHHPDVVLLDLMMPRMNGLAVLRAIRSTAGLDDIGIVLQTAYSDRDNVVTAQRMGCKHILCKPLQKDRLLAEIENCLRGRPSRRPKPVPVAADEPETAAVAAAVAPEDLAAALAAAGDEVDARRLTDVLTNAEMCAYARALVASENPIGQRLVRVANSPFYGGRSPVRTVAQALVRIGTRAARDLLRKASPAARRGLTLEQTVRVLGVLEIVSNAFSTRAARPQELATVLEQLSERFRSAAEKAGPNAAGTEPRGTAATVE